MKNKAIEKAERDCEVHYKTEKQKNEKHRYFQSLEQVKEWVRKHKTADISAASWQVFSIMEGLR